MSKRNNRGESVKSPPRCPMCGGPGIFLGMLATLKNFRCRNCGAMWSKEKKKSRKDWS